MREAFEIANTTSPEVSVYGDTFGFQRVYMGTYETPFGEVSVARSTYQRKGTEAEAAFDAAGLGPRVRWLTPEVRTAL